MPIETLLGRRRHDDSVHDERSCSVEPLRNPVFPFFQIRPMFPLKADRLGQPAHTQNCAHFASPYSFKELTLLKPHSPAFLIFSDFAEK